MSVSHEMNASEDEDDLRFVCDRIRAGNQYRVQVAALSEVMSNQYHIQ